MNAPVNTLRKLPIGIQSFEKLRSEGFLYVDKTALVFQLAQAGIPCFLSRPRRFGKSLLLSTFEAYFKGKKELFKGLAIEQLEQNWFEYPVLHLDLKYNTLCGMTRPEIEAIFVPELQELARLTDTTYDEAVEQLTRQYDGYRFTPDKGFTPMYNPFSVLSALAKSRFGDYWFASGTPTFLVEILKKTEFDLRELDGIEVSSASLSDDRADISNPIPMIYQSGYLTIKSYDKEFREYKLGFPNEEVKYGLLNFAAPYYTPVASTDTSFYIGKFVRELRSGETEAFLNRLACFFADFPYELNDKTERHYQVVFYLVFKLMGQFTQAEVRTAIGRADAVVSTPDYIYVFEFKLHGTAEEALKQIDEKGYLLPYTVDGRKLVKVGVSFDAEKRNLGEWLIV